MNPNDKILALATRKYEPALEAWKKLAPVEREFLRFRMLGQVAVQLHNVSGQVAQGTQAQLKVLSSLLGEAVAEDDAAPPEKGAVAEDDAAPPEKGAGAAASPNPQAYEGEVVP